MAIQQKLHTKLVQKLILTPSLQQAIKLLPMSTLESRRRFESAPPPSVRTRRDDATT